MNSLYFDYNASTPMDPLVFRHMEPYLCHEFGNPNSNHVKGWTAKKALDRARLQVANLLGSEPSDVIFTSGATEATSLGLLGVFYDQILNKKNLQPHFITTDVEHACVLETYKLLARLGAEVTVLSTKPHGQLLPEVLEAALRPNTVLVSVIWVNNEVGTINDIKKLCSLAHAKGALFHTDGTQGVGKFPILFKDWQIDLLSLSGHKLYGPKGVGALVRRSRQPRVELVSLVAGGGQEQAIRSGTQNVAAIVGLGEACEICQNKMNQDSLHAQELGKILLEGLRDAFPDLILNGHPTARSEYNYNVTFPSLNLDIVSNLLVRLCTSRGSACHSNDPTRRDVLTTLGVDEKLAGRSLRFSLGRMSTRDEVTQAIEIFKKIALQRVSEGGLSRI